MSSISPFELTSSVTVQIYKNFNIFFFLAKEPAMGNFTEEVMQTPHQPTLLATVVPVEDIPPQSQSDASETSSGGNRIPQEMISNALFLCEIWIL